MLPIYFLSLIFSVNAQMMVTPLDYRLTFDQDLYEEVLDQELCHAQIQYLIKNNTNLLLRFLHAGIRTPRGLLDGNLADLGNYYQCLGIDHEAPSTSSTIKGKYCVIKLPLSQDISIDLPSLPDLPDIPWPKIPWPEWNPQTLGWSEGDVEKLVQYGRIKRNIELVLGGASDDRISSDSPLSDLSVKLAMCIPKTCTTGQAITELLFNITRLGLNYEDRYCRLPNDKLWVAADYVAIAVFSFLLLLCIASTGYDVYQTVIIGIDPKKLIKIYTSFSVYTNTRRLISYTSVPGAIECIDGVRSFAMMWVIVGHTYVNQLGEFLANPLDVLNWITSPWSVWVSMAPITVDTFFMLSGLLLVYTTAGKLTRATLLRNLHLFYLNRLLRMFPLLAAFILLQASLLNRLSDGPYWSIMAQQTNQCRDYWWSTLLHVQNWVNPDHVCLPHSWYLAVDVQLYILSPLILFWVLGTRRRVAWIALFAALALSLGGATVYNFIMEFQVGPVIPSRDEESQSYYIQYYYFNTLARSSPFVIGMIYGYILHLNKQQKIRIPMIHAATLWVCAVIILATVTYVTYPYMQLDWDNQTVDNIINSFMRPAWALALGWIILASHLGMGGPINWVLSLQCFKLLSRLSYAMYIVHYPLIFVVNSSKLSPGYFSATASLFQFLADFSLAAIVAFLLTLLVDSPYSMLIKHFLGDGQRLPAPVKNMTQEPAPSNGVTNQAYVNEETKKN